tara:strand:- start:1912 stop:2313 length:402 start_codon:yes stop_codon:yes gene_type:complete
MKSTEQNGFMEAWERSKPYMVTALKKAGDQYDVDDLLSMIKEDRAIFYPVQNGAAVFQVAVYPKRRRLRLWLIGGEVGEGVAKLDAVMEAAEFLAEKHGCDGIECTGQIAYKRVLKPYGYKHKGVVLTKELGD